MSKKTIAFLVAGAALFAALVVTFVVLRMVFVPYRQPSASMYPALPVHSHFTANRFDKKPEYGAVIVFRFPENPDQEFDKRIVGLPGDTIMTRGTTVTIDGWEVPHCLVGTHSYADEDMGTTHSGILEVEWLGDATYLVFHDAHATAMDFGPYVVKPGETFVMGDNRENSHDSRRWFGGAGGGVPDANVIGRVRMPPLALPKDAESLRGALDACLAKRPSKTRP